MKKKILSNDYAVSPINVSLNNGLLLLSYRKPRIVRSLEDDPKKVEHINSLLKKYGLDAYIEKDETR